MLTAEDNDLLTLTGPDQPMGNVFRQYWMPVLLSSELNPDGEPKRIRLLGEDFVAFRDTNGDVGVIEPRCSHRGANLFFGRNEQCGLRCVYHGWKFNVRGECVDLPTSDATIASTLKPKAAIRALAVEEYGDIIWVHFSQTASRDTLPTFEFAELPEEQRFVSKKFQQCNWAQAVEGGIDTAHFSYLHANYANGEKVPLMAQKDDDEPPANARYRWLIEDGSPQFTVLQHDAGLVLGAARKADNNQLYWRITQFMMPNHSLVPNSFPGDMHQGNTWVPVDDVSTWIFCYAYHPDRALTSGERKRFSRGGGVFSAVDEDYFPHANRENDYQIDRNLQKQGNFTGIRGISEQDAAIADSQGLIADRTRELLGQTDLGVVRFRRMMLNAAREVGQRLPHGATAPAAYNIRSGDAMSAADTPLSDVLNERFGDMGGVGVQA